MWLVAAAGACSPAAVSSPAPPTPSAAASAASPSESGTIAGSPSSGTVAVDGALLGILPPEVDGRVIVESPEGEAQALGDPNLPPLAARIATGVAANPASGDFVYAVVVALRPGVMSDAVFRGWRDSFDRGACSQAGGVSGHAEAQLGGRTVFIGSCAGGLHTYHVWLPRLERLVSASAVGERRFGELLVKAIRD